VAALHERTRDIMDKLRETLRDEHSFSFQARAGRTRSCPETDTQLCSSCGNRNHHLPSCCMATTAMFCAAFVLRVHIAGSPPARVYLWRCQCCIPCSRRLYAVLMPC